MFKDISLAVAVDNSVFELSVELGDQLFELSGLHFLLFRAEL
jgi:hypothetical protein